MKDPMLPYVIPLSEPSFDGMESAYVQECLKSGWISSAGPFVNRLEDEFSRLFGGYAVATSSGTAALHLALVVAGIGPEDEVVLPTLSFIAPANAIRYVGGTPVFVDASPNTWQMDVGLLESFLVKDCRPEVGGIRNLRTGRLIRAVVPVHILGHPTDMDPLLELAREFQLIVIEDSTESLGASYRGLSVGTLGDIGCFSFNGNKLVTTGGGGMVVTKREDWAIRIRHLATQAKTSSSEYIHDEIGFNYRLSNISAAIGCAQLERLEAKLDAKRRIAHVYRESLAHTDGISFLDEPEGARSAYWLSTCLVDPRKTGIDSRGLRDALGEKGIESRPLWQPLHMSVPHLGSQALRGEVAVDIYSKALSLPSSVGLSAEDQTRVLGALTSAVRGPIAR